MNFNYFFPSSDGDIPVSSEKLQNPFLNSAKQSHNSLTLGEYFQALKKFVLDHIEELISIAAEKNDINNNLQINRAILRSEKHGAFYHIASVEFFFNNHSIKYAITTAVSSQGRKLLRKDFSLMTHLISCPGPAYIPKPYLIKEIQLKDNNNVPGVMAVTEWLEDFHEWHLSHDETGNNQIVIWNYNDSNRFLTPKEKYQVFKQASEILTNFFDLQTFRLVYPWHHAAGDFIVKCDDDKTEVRLITIREYLPLLDIPPDHPAAQISALISFFLHLSIRMRLDKYEGVGETAWIDDFTNKAVIDGFFSVLSNNLDPENLTISPAELLEMLQTFSPIDLINICQPLLDIYKTESENDYLIILSNINEHLEKLCQNLNKFNLRQLNQG